MGLLANLRRVKAQDRLHKGLFDSTDYRGVYGLYMDAYGNEQLATEAQTLAMKAAIQQRTK